MLVLLLVFRVFVHVGTAISVAPTWVTSSLVKADQYNLIATKTGNNITPSVTMTFSSAFTAPPHLGYGIINYEGNNVVIVGNDEMGK